MRLMFIAGEVSGDLHAAALLTALRRRRPEVAAFGIGGDALRAAGMEILVDARDMAVMGLTEVLARYPFFRRVFAQMLACVRERKPEAVILVDYPGFNLRFAAALRALGVTTIYYVCPQVWAWHRSRIGTMARDIDRLLTIFPFEPAVFAGTGLQVDFVGHPLVDAARIALAQPPADLPWHADGPRIALLPGSRRHEVERLLPAMLSAAAIVAQDAPGASFIVACPPGPVPDLTRGLVAGRPAGGPPVEIVSGRTLDVLRQARAGLVASGTATIDAALMNCPMVVVYRTSMLTYWLGRMLVQVPHIGMVNIVAGRGLCPELIQGAASARGMAGALAPMLPDGSARQALLDGLAGVRRALGDGGAADRAAECVLAELASSS